MVDHTKPKKTSPSSEPRKNSKQKSSEQQLSEIQTAAAQAQAAYQWEKALPLYTQALAVRRQGKQPDSSNALLTEYNLLDGQAECYRNLGNFAAETEALESMVELARKLEDPACQARALLRRTVTAIRLGNLSNAQQLAETALRLARKSFTLPEATRRKLEAKSLFLLGDSRLRLGDYTKAKEVEEKALELYRQLGDQAGEAQALWGLGFVENRSGRYTQTAEYFTRSLELFRRAGDREGMGNALNGLAIITKDLALARTHLEQALAAFEAIGNRERQAIIHNNLSVGYFTLGLYHRAIFELEPLIEIARSMQTRQSLVYYLGNLGSDWLALDEYEQARLLTQEALELAIECGERKMIANTRFSLGQIQLQTGHPDEATQFFLDSLEEGKSLDIPENASGLAWLSAAYLAQGKLDLAFQATTQGLAYLSAHGNTTGEMPLNEFWWLRYKTLSALTALSPRPDFGEGGEDLGELAWQALDQARVSTLEPIASLSDDGLRRNYFNKVDINRQIVREWLRMAKERGLPLNPLTDHFSQPGDLQGQFQRMLDIGVRLNSRASTQDLPRFILNEVVELTGADRASLYLVDETGGRKMAAEETPHSPQPSPQGGEGTNEEELLEEVSRKRAALLRYFPEGAPELEQQSMLSVPLMIQGKLVGLIYVELSGIYGRFTSLDRDLLSVLANQAAVAIENANWASNLEQRVEQRTAELALINRVQQALAAQLDTQAIIDLVGEEIRKLFDAQVFQVVHYDREQDLCHWLYTIEDDERQTVPPGPRQSLSGHILDTRQPLMINQDMKKRSAALGGISSGPQTKSYLGVPILIGDEARGVISLQNTVHENAFSESDLRLLTTLANSMGVALENARLFDETRRLLGETEQRNNELAIINSVQQGLAAELDFQAIVDLVGDKLREIFKTPDLAINWYDEKANLGHPLYMYEHGRRITLPPSPPRPDGPFSRMLQTHQPIIYNTAEEGDAISLVIPGTDASKSGIFIPIISSDRVLGSITVENYEREYAYGESEVRLLTTIAASLGAALENAHLFDETQRLLKETEQRAAELGILNSVGEAMSKTLDVKTLTRIVGDKVRDIFVANSVQITLLDSQTNLIHPQYEFDIREGGYIDYVQPFPLGTGLTSKVISSRRPLLLGTFEELAANGAYFPPEVVERGLGVHSQSYLGVPIIANDRVLGVVALGDYQPNAYNENHLRLLQTLASNMGVAIENARLFQAEQQRVAELAIINSVQAALAAELNIQGIYDTVGDKIREIFHNTDMGIRIYDPKTNLEHFPYIYENGERITVKPDPLPEKGFSAHVIRSRETLVINENMLQEVEKYGSYAIPGTQMEKSAVFVPMVVGDQVRGLINLTNMEREYAFSDADVRLLQTLANSMSVALENARLFDETQRLLVETQQRTAELEIINRVGMSLARQLDYQAIVALVGERLREIFPGQMCSIALYNKVMDTVSWPYFAGFDGQQISQRPVALGEGLTSHVIQSRQPLVLGSLKEAERYGMVWLFDSADQEPKSWIGVPILVSDEAMGVLAVQDMPENRYSENDVRLLATLAASMGVALENARLFDETRRLLAETEQRASEMAALAEIGNDIASTHELKPVLERLMIRTKELLNVSEIVLFMVDPSGETLNAEVALGKYTDEIKATSLKIGEGIIGYNASQGRAEIVQHPIHDPRVIHIQGTPEEEDEAEGLMCAPLISRNKVIGIIGVWREHTAGLFIQAELDLLVSLARQAAIAIESARLFMETERRASQMATIAEVGGELSATLDLQKVIEIVAGHAHRLFHARDTILRLVEPDGKNLRTVFALGTYPDQFTADIIPIGQGITGCIAQTGIAEVINDVAHDTRGVHVSGTPDQEEDPETLMVAPLITHSRTVGTLSVYHSQREGLFTQVDLDFLVGLGRQAAIAIENARLFAEVQEQKQFSESLVQNSPVAIVTADNQYIVTSWNQGAERLFGYSLQEAIGRDLNQLVAYQIDLHDEAVRYDAQTSGGEPVHGITRRCRKDGSLVDVELSGVPVIIDGKPTGVIAIYHDITELKRAETEILESQRRLASIIDFLPDATLVIDKQGKVIAWNRAIEEMTGVKAAEMLGKGDYEYAIPFYGERRPILVDLVFKPREELEKNYVSVQQQGEVLIGETYVSRLKGGGHYLLGTASVLHDTKGQEVGAIEIVRDITERKQAEDELQKAKAAAESANQAKSAFLAMMSHEIRTPMNAIIGMSGLLIDTPLNAEQRDFAETIRTSGDALLTIINDILDFSKIDAGKMQLEEQPFDLRECLEASMDLIRLRASEKGLELAYVMEPDVPPAIIGDVTRLRQILINLLNNAVKFTEQGEVVLTLSCEPVRGDASHQATAGGKPGPFHLHFSVRDTGIGIPPDQLERLFQAFSQADASTSRRYGGTGLGLAISKRLSELMGGKMWVESEGVPGKGSTFHFNLIAQAATDFQARSHRIGEQPQLVGKPLLIVDDNATNRRILALQTKNWGMLPRDTAAPSEALAWLQRGDPFDLGILDMQMPEIDGPGLAIEIRKLRDEKSLPLVLSSSIGIRDTGIAPGSFNGFLLKPIRPSALFDSLITILAAGTTKSEETVPVARQMDSEMASTHPLRILVAEDNVVNQKLALRLLSQMGYRADVAANGLEAIRSLERQPYDVILMDVQMPEMDGLEASRQICARWQREVRPRIIAMTANAMQGDREMCLEAGMDDYISKPVRVNELVSALSKATPVK